MARLELTALSKTYGDVRAVAGVDLGGRRIIKKKKNEPSC
jgi:hypothetical protein